MTEPPAKATSRALPRLVLAALVVLTLALVATLIPMYPARPEQTAPIIKDTATRKDEFSESAETPSRMATANTKIAKTLYSALRKAIAPSAIFLAMVAIRSVPTSCLETQAERQKVYKSAKIPNTGIAYVMVCSIVIYLLSLINKKDFSRRHSGEVFSGFSFEGQS
jgi:branched-subunit amino acid transport protein AzlD